MAVILQITFPHAFSSVKIFVACFKFPCSHIEAMGGFISNIADYYSM